MSAGLEAEGLTLVPLDRVDGDTYAQVAQANSSDLVALDMLSAPGGEGEVRERWAGLLTLLDEGGGLSFGIYDDGLVGEVTVSDLHSQEPELEIWVDRGQRGRGIASRAVTIVTAHLFETRPDVTAVTGRIRQDNAASQGMAEKVGASRGVADSDSYRTWRIERES